MVLAVGECSSNEVIREVEELYLQCVGHRGGDLCDGDVHLLPQEVATEVDGAGHCRHEQHEETDGDKALAHVFEALSGGEVPHGTSVDEGVNLLSSKLCTREREGEWESGKRKRERKVEGRE